MEILGRLFQSGDTPSSHVSNAPEKRKYVKRKKMFTFSSKKVEPLPQKSRARDTSRYVSKATVQGRITAKILTLEVGEMFTMTFNADPSEVSARLTVFRKRFPDIKITTRRINDNTIGIWRV